MKRKQFLASPRQPAIFSAGLRHLGSGGIGIYVTKGLLQNNSINIPSKLIHWG